MADLSRREALRALAVAGAAAATGCTSSREPTSRARAAHTPTRASTGAVEGTGAILRTSPLGFPWDTPDPFLACMHHDDLYPAGNDRLGPAPQLLAGREMGRDFAGLDGWRMYHGRVVPGFPAHPHRGFETVTVVRRGLLDHSDSLGATARYGQGDVQWLTAGAGIQHAEMFPLLVADGPNPLELFQLWLNLPRVDKMAAPEFKMLWADTIPRHVVESAGGARTELVTVAGRFDATAPPAPPRSSWGARADADLAIWTIDLSPGARFDLPPAAEGSNRSLYFFRGAEMAIGGRAVPVGQRVELAAARAVTLENGDEPAEVLMLQGRPIGEPVAHRGPFVMNTQEELRQAFRDYQATRFGGWPWASDDPVHERTQGRFARHPDGRMDRPA